jgi:hypothetical protein
MTIAGKGSCLCRPMLGRGVSRNDICWERKFSVMPSDVKNLELVRGVVRDGKCKEGVESGMASASKGCSKG